MSKNNDVFDLNSHRVSYLMKLFLLVMGLGGVILLRIIRPVLFIRIGILVNERLGELATRTETYLRRNFNKKLSSREIHIFISGKPANEQLFKMIRRKIPVLVVNHCLLWSIRKLQSFFRKSELWLDYGNCENRYFEFNTKPSQLTFTSEEEELGRRLLEDLGVGSKSPFVCVNVRDKAYLDKIHPYRNRTDWSYQDYRDADIDNYVPAAEYLASLGIYVIRMGFMVEKEFGLPNPYVIDYANKYRSDFGDIYLSAKCKFFIGSEGGLITVPWIFNVPVAYSNRIPVTAIAGWHRSNIFLPKKLWLKSKQRFLTFREIHNWGACSWFRSEPYQQAGIEVVENTPEEIFGLVREMNERLDGTWVTTEEDEALQKRYWGIWPKDLDSYRSSIPLTVEYSPARCHGSYPRISTEFLRRNQELLEIGKHENIIKTFVAG